LENNQQGQQDVLGYGLRNWKGKIVSRTRGKICPGMEHSNSITGDNNDGKPCASVPEKTPGKDSRQGRNNGANG